MQVAPKQQLSPYQIDLRNGWGNLNLSRHKLLNFAPSSYFDYPVLWQPPSDWVVADFMTQIGFARFAPYSERIRLFADGTVYVRASSGVWCQIFGLMYDFRQIDRPARVINTLRFKEVKDSRQEQFLEDIV